MIGKCRECTKKNVPGKFRKRPTSRCGHRSQDQTGYADNLPCGTIGPDSALRKRAKRMQSKKRESSRERIVDQAGGRLNLDGFSMN